MEDDRRPFLGKMRSFEEIMKMLGIDPGDPPITMSMWVSAEDKLDDAANNLNMSCDFSAHKERFSVRVPAAMTDAYEFTLDYDEYRGLHVLRNSNGLVMVSPDGEHWTTVESGSVKSK